MDRSELKEALEKECQGMSIGGVWKASQIKRPHARESGGRTDGIGCWVSWVVLAFLSCSSNAPAPVLNLPDRPDQAPGGAEIASDIRPFALEAREDRLFREVSQGNVPSWLRRLEEVRITREIDGRAYEVTFWVTPDYLSVGSDEDFFLAPMSPQTAQRIADLLEASLPTPLMVDAVWASARHRLPPIRIEPDEYMTTVRYFQRHDRLVHAQRRLLGVPPGSLVAGHKKDVVLSARLARNPGKVAVYGWHGTDGEPIQSLTTVLNETWVGFNHGVRLVAREILVNGVPRDMVDVLRDPELAPLLSNEGVIAEAQYPVRRGQM
jgi:hypothetical protein